MLLSGTLSLNLDDKHTQAILLFAPSVSCQLERAPTLSGSTVNSPVAGSGVDIQVLGVTKQTNLPSCIEHSVIAKPMHRLGHGPMELAPSI